MNHGNFEWVPFFKELSNKLGDFDDRQPELVGILNRGRKLCGLGAIQDRDSDQQAIQLEEIDPFTFMAVIMTTGAANRIVQLESIAKDMGLRENVPTVFDGVPSANAQRAWMFRFSDERSDSDIPTLWDVYTSARKKSLTPEQWKQALNLWGVGQPKLTQALFWCFPEDFLPLDRQTWPFLIAKGIREEQPRNDETLNSYTELLGITRDELKMPFYEVSYNAWLYNQELDKGRKGNMGRKDKEDLEGKRLKKPLNQILYGPPGTGKTYNTVIKAVEICDGEASQDYQKTKNRYNELKEDGRIDFITFHQSYGYEEFIEGIRAETIKNKDGKGSISYDVKPGVFKRICELAQTKVVGDSADIDNLSTRKIWKMSLGNTQSDEGHVYQDCIDNNYILLGYGADIDFATCKNKVTIQHNKA